MAADFSGYATKNGLKCTDGRTIIGGAFKHQDKTKVPLVWQHQYNEPSNILGHALLENRADGVYALGFFNDTEAAKNAKALVVHGDITALSIYANRLIQQGSNVVHGDIREVSLVLSGANPEAIIDNVSLAHGDRLETLEDEAVIYTGLSLEHEDADVEPEDVIVESDVKETTPVVTEIKEENVVGDEVLKHAAVTQETTVKDVFDTLTEEQKNVVYFMLGSVLEDNATSNVQHSQEGTDMSRNVFEQNVVADGPSLSHAQIKSIVADAQKNGSFRDSFLAHAQEYGIENIDILFPDAQSVTSSPEILGRRQEWVAGVIDGAKHSPLSRIKSTAADLTADEARAKGYVKGNLKKDEVIKLLKRVTTPTTVYKKQKLDRDDIVDITDLDVVAWLKAEMRLMLDEELARAVLVGDGREPDDEDKIDEDHLRPIAFDDDMYTHKINLAANSSASDLEESILRARTYYKGTGTPTMYTTDGIITDLLLQKDKMNRRIYDSVEQLAAALRVRAIVAAEVLEDTPSVQAIIVNIADYTLGADRGGQISLFDDFDIDYNQYKYLIETRVSGALTKPKSALVITRTTGTVVSPTQPTYNPVTHVIGIPAVTGVIYSIDGVDKTAGNITIVETTEVEARPAATYTFPHNIDTDWTFVF